MKLKYNIINKNMFNFNKFNFIKKNILTIIITISLKK